jgi:hypothetical protein
MSDSRDIHTRDTGLSAPFNGIGFCRRLMRPALIPVTFQINADRVSRLFVSQLDRAVVSDIAFFCDADVRIPQHVVERVPASYSEMADEIRVHLQPTLIQFHEAIGPDRFGDCAHRQFNFMVGNVQGQMPADRIGNPQTRSIRTGVAWEALRCAVDGTRRVTLLPVLTEFSQTLGSIELLAISPARTARRMS